MIDWERLQTMRDEIGSDSLEEIVLLFLPEMDEGISRLQSAPSTEALGAEMHFLKGCALNLGFRDFARLCQEAETLCAQGKADQVDIGRILACHGASCAVFSEGPDAADAT